MFMSSPIPKDQRVLLPPSSRIFGQSCEEVLPFTGVAEPGVIMHAQLLEGGHEEVALQDSRHTWHMRRTENLMSHDRIIW